jgi:hypothetical protein
MEKIDNFKQAHHIQDAVEAQGMMQNTHHRMQASHVQQVQNNQEQVSSTNSQHAKSLSARKAQTDQLEENRIGKGRFVQGANDALNYVTKGAASLNIGRSDEYKMPDPELPPTGNVMSRGKMIPQPDGQFVDPTKFKNHN